MHVHMYGEARGQHCLLKTISPLHILETVCLLEPGSYYFGPTEILIWSLRDPQRSFCVCVPYWDYMYLQELRSLLCWYGLQQTFPSGNIYLNPSLISFNSPLASHFIYDLMFAWLLGKTTGIFAEHHKTSASSNPKDKMR